MPPVLLAHACCRAALTPGAILGTHSVPPREAFIREVSQPDEDIDLGAAALYLAAGHCPGLDVVAYQGRLAQLGQRVRAALPRRPNTYDAIHAANVVLFDEEGYSGNGEAFYDPRNSYLNDVIDRKLGIPITLSVLYMEVARRAGHRFRGIGMPSHFLVAAGQGPSEIFIDPFNRGGLLTRREAVAMALRGREAGLPERNPILVRRLLPPVDKRMILRRLLNNLKLIHSKEKDSPRALTVAERIQLLEPADWRNLSDLARLQTEMGLFSEAAASLTAFIQRAPSGMDTRLAENALRQLRTLAGGAGPGGNNGG